MSVTVPILGLCLVPLLAAQTPQEEVEQKVQEIMAKIPTKLRIDYESLDIPKYKLTEAIVELDGTALPPVPLSTLDSEGKHAVFYGDVTPGHHKVTTSIALRDSASPLVSSEGGFTWNVKSSVEFDHQMGLEIQITIVPKLNPGEKDPKKKFSLSHTHKIKAIAEPHSQPVLAKASDEPVADAPTEKKLTARERANQAKQRASEAAGSTEVKADAPKAQRAAAAPSKSGEPSPTGDEPSQGRMKAAANQERAVGDSQKLAASDAKVAADEPFGDAPATGTTADASTMEPAPPAASEDAGAVAAVTPPVVPKTTVSPVTEVPESSWWPWLAAGLVGAAIIFLVARRKGP